MPKSIFFSKLKQCAWSWRTDQTQEKVKYLEKLNDIAFLLRAVVVILTVSNKQHWIRCYLLLWKKWQRLLTSVSDLIKPYSYYRSKSTSLGNADKEDINEVKPFPLRKRKTREIELFWVHLLHTHALRSTVTSVILWKRLPADIHSRET